MNKKTATEFIRNWVGTAVAFCTKRGKEGPKSDRSATLHVYTVTVLVEDKDSYDPPSLDALAFDIGHGDLLGDWTYLGSRRLNRKETHAACIAVRNDGSYFNNF